MKEATLPVAHLHDADLPEAITSHVSSSVAHNLMYQIRGDYLK